MSEHGNYEIRSDPFVYSVVVDTKTRLQNRKQLIRRQSVQRSQTQQERREGFYFWRAYAVRKYLV